MHRRHDLVVENNIMGIQVEIIKARSMEEVGESTRLDIQMDFNEIHVSILLPMLFRAFGYHNLYFCLVLF